MGSKIKEYQSFDIDFSFPFEDEEMKGRYELLQALELSLKMRHVKAFKGEKRREKLFDALKILRGLVLPETTDVEETFSRFLEEQRRLYLTLPKEMLSTIKDIDGIVFGEYSDETYALLKGYFYAEKRALCAHFEKRKTER